MPELLGGVSCNRYASLLRFQPWTEASPALDSLFPNRIHLSPTRRSIMHANEKGKVNGYIGNDNGQQAR